MILKYFFNTTRRAGRPLFTEKEKSQARRFHITLCLPDVAAAFCAMCRRPNDRQGVKRISFVK